MKVEAKRCRGWQGRFALTGWLLAVAMFWACKSPPPPDSDGVRGQARDVAASSQLLDRLDCRAGDCADWYRIVVDDLGRLTVSTAATLVAGGEIRYTLRLEDGFGVGIDELAILDGERRSISQRVSPGAYLLGVTAEPSSAALAYELEAEFRATRTARPPDPPPPPPPPRDDSTRTEVAEPRNDLARVEVEILEVEGTPTRPTAVLIDFGSQRGARWGMLGELVDGGDVVGTIELRDIYPEGSRASIVGELTGAITPDVRAVLFVEGDGSGSDETSTDMER